MPCVRGIKVRRLEDFEIEDLADRYRDRYARASYDEAVDMEQLLEDIDGRPIDLPEPINGKGKIGFSAVEKLPPNVLGRTRFDAETRTVVLEVSDETYKRTREWNQFSRLTIAHELFHIKKHLRDLLKISELTNEQFSLARSMSSHKSHRDSEWQAERFAPAFIAPAEGLRHMQRNRTFTLYDVQRTFRINRLLAQYRMADFFNAERERERHGRRR